jgi:hypothetical protein
MGDPSSPDLHARVHRYGSLHPHAFEAGLHLKRTERQPQMPPREDRRSGYIDEIVDLSSI